jgi:hypothetical protein
MSTDNTEPKSPASDLFPDTVSDRDAERLTESIQVEQTAEQALRARADADSRSAGKARIRVQSEAAAIAAALSRSRAEQHALVQARARADAEALALETSKRRLEEETAARELAESRLAAESRAASLAAIRAEVDRRAEAEALARERADAEAVAALLESSRAAREAADAARARIEAERLASLREVERAAADSELKQAQADLAAVDPDAAGKSALSGYNRALRRIANSPKSVMAVVAMLFVLAILLFGLWSGVAFRSELLRANEAVFGPRTPAPDPPLRMDRDDGRFSHQDEQRRGTSPPSRSTARNNPQQ